MGLALGKAGNAEERRRKRLIATEEEVFIPF